MKKKRIKWILYILCIFGSVTFLYKVLPLIEQEKDFIKIVSGISKLHLGSSDMICYKEDEIYYYYVSKSQSYEEPLKTLLDQRDFMFDEQMGSAYNFKHKYKEDKRVIVTSRQFSRYYRQWNVPKEID